MAAILAQKIRGFAANAYLTDFSVSDPKEIVGMLVVLDKDTKDLSRVKAVPFMGTGATVGHVNSIIELPKGYDNATAGPQRMTVTIIPFMAGFNAKAKNMISAGDFVSIDSTAPHGLISHANSTGAIGIAIEKGIKDAQVPIVLFKEF